MKPDSLVDMTSAPAYPPEPLPRSAMPLALAVFACAAGAAFLDTYPQRVLATAFLYLTLAQAWNLIGGYAGLMSLAMPAFFGTGAVVVGVMTLNGVHPLLATTAAVVAAACIAVVIGWPTLRLAGHYFVVATLLATEALRNLVLNLDFMGFSGSTALNIFNLTSLAQLGPAEFNLLFYMLLLGAAAATMVLLLVIESSRTGYALRAIRDNERAARALSIDAASQKMRAFVLSAVISGFVGAVWAYWLGIVDTNEAFSLRLAFDVIVIVFIGGRGTLWGPVAGTALMTLINETIGVELPELHLVASGLLVAFVVLFLPDGVAGLFKRGIQGLHPRELLQNLRRYRMTK